MANEEESGKMEEIRNKMIEIKDPNIEEETTKTTVTTIKKDKETDYSKTIRHGIIDLSSYTMLNEEKRQRFSTDLKKDETINEYVDDQFYTKWLKSNNPHVRAGIVYSYLYIKNLNTL